MGASVAALLALAHVDDDSVWPSFSKTSVYCMAAGPCVSRNLAEACKAFCLGAVRGRDPIARLSVLSVEGLLDELVDQGLEEGSNNCCLARRHHQRHGAP